MAAKGEKTTMEARGSKKDLALAGETPAVPGDAPRIAHQKHPAVVKVNPEVLGGAGREDFKFPGLADDGRDLVISHPGETRVSAKEWERIRGFEIGGKQMIVKV